MQPNYSDYSLSELQEALSSIDKDAFPSRVSEIETEIKKRKVANPKFLHSVQQKKLGIGGRIFLFAMSLLLLFYGIDALFDSEIATKNNRTLTLEGNAFLFYCLVILNVGIGLFLLYLSLFGKEKRQHGT